MNRSKRNFIVGIPVLFAGVIGYRERAELSSVWSKNNGHDKVMAFIHYPVHVAAVGNVYLYQFPDRAGNAQLLQKLTNYLQIDDWSLTEQEFEQLLLKRIETDYKTGQTVMLDGWVLSRTEGVVAALVAANNKD